jgi:hypothetical protein
MNKTQLLCILGFGGLAIIISCDNGTAATTGGLDVNDCPVGTFRPVGITDCVFPAVDVNGNTIGFSDNRCAFGQPAVPAQCVSDAGGRAYLASSTKCAPGYRYEPGACNRNNGTAGFATGFGTGDAGSFGTAGSFGGEAGAAGSFMGFAGDFGTGSAGSPVTGSGGTGATAGTGGQAQIDGSSDAS